MMTETDKEQNKSSLNEHKERNQEAQAAKATDNERAICEKTFKSVTFDLQSVLQIPSSEVSIMYYKRKLCCYNFTIYE